jgi:hypothetical protein
VTTPVALWPPLAAPDCWKAKPTAESHADEARDQERAAAEAVDEGDRDESRDYVDCADRPGGGLGLRRGGRKACGGEDVVGIIDDRVDAGDLLQDCEAEADFQRRPPAGREHVPPRRHFVLGAQRRLDGREPRVGVVPGAKSDKRLAGVIAAAALGEPARRLKSGQDGEREENARARGDPEHGAPALGPASAWSTR